jgi:hypothetical protein
MRTVSLVMAFQLFALPQMLTAQSVVAIYEDSGSQPPPLLEEEVLKHACTIREEVCVMDMGAVLTAHFHQYEEAMRDHPLLDVPHLPPWS